MLSTKVRLQEPKVPDLLLGFIPPFQPSPNRLHPNGEAYRRMGRAHSFAFCEYKMFDEGLSLSKVLLMIHKVDLFNLLYVRVRNIFKWIIWDLPQNYTISSLPNPCVGFNGVNL